MSDDLERYKWNSLIIFVLLAYTSMRFFINGVYVEVTLEKLMHFEVIKPYAFRVLLPLLAYLLEPLGLGVTVFILIEFLSALLLYLGMTSLCRLYFSKREAKLFSLLFFCFLSLVYLINYRYPVGNAATFYFPYDSMALVFTVLGLYLGLTKQWLWLYVVMIFATLNRESSVLIALMLPAIYLGRETSWRKPFILSLSLYIVVRLVVDMCLQHTQGSLAELHNLTSGYPHLTENMFFLLQKNYFLWIMAEFAFMPLAWFCFSNYIPREFLRLRFVALFYVMGLFIVGNIIEGRLWGEVVVILYLPVLLGASNWLKRQKVTNFHDLSVVARIEHFAVIILLTGFFACGVIFYLHTAN